MNEKVTAIRQPLACFQGEITVEGEKTASAEEVKLAFDYFPVIDGQKESSASHKSSNNRNGNGARTSVSLENGSVKKSESGSPRIVKYDPSD